MHPALLAIDPALVRHLGETGRSYIAVRYSDGITSAGGPFSAPEAMRRAAMLMHSMPGAIGVRVSDKPEPPEATDGRRFMLLARRRSTDTNLVVGPFVSRKQAFARGGALLRSVPDAAPYDYELRVHYSHEPERYPRTRRRGAA